MKDKYPRLKLIWADCAHSGKLVHWVNEKLGCSLEIVKRSDDIKGFKNTSATLGSRKDLWFNRFRRLNKDFEYLFVISESNMYIAMISILLNRLAPARG